MADRRKLMAGILNLPESARKDLAQRAQDVEREGVVGMLRKATGEMYNNPIVNTAIGFTPGVGDVQAAGETFAALQRGAPWQETAGYAVGMLPFVPALRTTWHGSPHGFTKFDMSKIGTGEGAQAYGHGLYLAEARPVAEEYKQALSNPEVVLKSGERISNPVVGSNEDVAKAWLEEQFLKGSATPFDDAIARLNKLKVAANNPQQFEGAVDVLNQWKNEGATVDLGGYLYKVDLPDEQISKMLDYDLPLANQPEQVKQSLLQLNDPHINEALSTSPVYNEAGDYWSYMGNTYGSKNEALRDVTPAQLISGQRGSFASPQEASQRFYEAGIPGIRYLDQASRGAGEGTSNYVVFSDEIPQILERNGQPIAQALREYRGAHTAPGPEFGAQLHDVTGGGAMYPEDIYSAQGARIYGHGGSDVAMDKETMRIIQNMRNKPDEMVDIYRAVPNESDIAAINPGDWVTINPNYAKQHGESNLPEGYKILQQKVPAKSVWTNADSIHEYGYWPE